ncbi:hypothetical protein SLH46_09095 [Draconibacterium sp. IB214405]|uniref:hypothetical protein n=1 Tax=Draconibacterium sp. IB214405 TaxID=3097352 RepID=UPI002A0DDBCF|nr:hypothetical protein [Draconibacterium sp. IB214405]MDX8339335.1 hypothetical protein [Draconibacterium sp. IB214405]
MKAIILISSIFYILGLKVSNTIDLVKKSNPTEKIITHKVQAAEPEKNATFEAKAEEDAAEKKPTTANECLE